MQLFKSHAQSSRGQSAPETTQRGEPSDGVVIAIYDNKDAIEAAVKELQQASFDLSKISIVGRDSNSEDRPTAFVTTRDRVVFWGELGALFGGLWGFVTSAALIAIPDFGLVVTLGPLGAVIAGVLESAAVIGGLSALGAALFSLGVPEEHWPQYENELRAGKLLLVVKGSKAEIESADHVLDGHGEASSLIHYGPQARHG
jgi:hypothetical protein